MKTQVTRNSFYRKIRLTLIGTSLILLLSSCAVTSDLETLYGIHIEKQHMEVAVISSGCTKPEHFQIKTSGKFIEIHRKQTDFCRKQPQVITLNLPLDDSLTAKLLRNPIEIVKPSWRY